MDTACFQEDFESFAVAVLPREVIDARLSALERENPARAESIARSFREEGCGETLRPEAIAHAALPNWICTLPGRSERRIVVGAHFDKTGKGEGAADNWSGSALLPSLYASLRTRERVHTFEFIAFSDEEKGLIGSRHHVSQLDAARRSELDAMVNLDTLGLSSTKLEARVSNPRLLCLMLRLARIASSPVALIDANLVGTSDFAPFRKAGVPVLSIHSISQETLGILHTTQDRLDRIDRASYYESYRLIAQYLALLDGTLFPTEHPAAPTSAASRLSARGTRAAPR